MVPRKLFALLEVHRKFMEAQNGSGKENSNVKSACIDQINW